MDNQQGAIRAAQRNPAAQPASKVAPARRDIVVVGGSAGALDAMLAVAGAFDRAFAGSIFIVSHIGAHRSHLPELLAHAGALPARHPESGEAVRPGIVYVAPPDRHMLVENGRIRLSRGPRRHFTRPAVDPLFRSAALEYGARVIGVVLSGTGSDGTAGLDQIRRGGGLAVTQEPGSALYPEMPQNAAAAIEIDHVVAREELPALLRRLSAESVTMKPRPAAASQASVQLEERERPIALTCPECGGALRENGTGMVKQYRCHIGHRFAPEEVLTGQLEAVEHALGVAVRVLNERIELCRHMADNARAGGRTMGVDHWRRLEKEAGDQLGVLQRFLAQQPVIGEPEAES